MKTSQILSITKQRLENDSAVLWELVEKPVKVSDLIDSLLDLFDVDRETCEKDVLKFLNELNKDKIWRSRGNFRISDFGLWI